jgi:hypothetical protein
VNSITKGNGLTFYWSNRNDKGRFNVPKIIMVDGNGAASYPVIDQNGDYALTQWMYAIIDEPENFENIKKALENPRFIEIMNYAPKDFANPVNRKVLATFRKDFWKEFI